VPSPAVDLEAGIVSTAADELAAYYEAAFGFSVVARYDFPQGRVVRLRLDGAGLKIFQPADAARRPPLPEPWHRDAGFAYAALHVADVAAVHRRALDHGARGLVEPVAHRPGARYALVADPEGNVWELLEER
jgi:uncharacterized glyoxalase superfamily protein PhnB